MERGSPKEILRRFGLRAKKSWGQSFLADESALERIARAVELRPGEPVLELGPGLGHLTRFLVATGARVIAVERDRDMVRVLKETMPEVRVVEANAAKVDFAALAGAEKVAVVGNLPYHLTSPILFQVLGQRATVSRAVFTLQKEVVRRLCAEPGGRDYGLLTALLGLYFEIDEVCTLSAALFHPRPRVDSAVVRLRTLPAPRAEVRSDERFKRLVKAAFAQRRKTLLNSLRSDPSLGGADELRRALAAAEIDPSRRAETLSPEELARIERHLPAGV
ncbi:MAG: 16S rRNA (adenine(1518)-N(6)/adenine(1519)-N(6))-dimethyltransferase RsmA [Myxococcales bacterium]|nr:16S rRNA (adenine(1518)-N(6)/adenine(1519)-N(6))-dimethyltransferase RsmA [Myxococcales bacterium]